MAEFNKLDDKQQWRLLMNQGRSTKDSSNGKRSSCRKDIEKAKESQVPLYKDNKLADILSN